MVTGSETMMETKEHLEAEAERGKRFLDKLELAEAEEIFRDILHRVPVYQNLQTDEVITSSLFGLAEIHAKHCRSPGVTQLDWACGMLFALLFYRETSETCAKIIRHRSPRKEESKRNQSRKRDYFSDTLARAKSCAYAVEVTLLEALKGKVLEDCTSNFRPIFDRRKTTFDDTWLEGLWDFCCRSANEYRSDVNGNDDTESQLHGSGTIGEDSKGTVPRRRRFSLIAKDPADEILVQPSSMAPSEIQNERPSSPTGSTISSISSTKDASSKRRINFDRFQDAIKQFVSDVSQDIRCKYSHISGKVPRELLGNRVCSELALRLSSPDCQDGQELQTIFENLLSEDDDTSTADTVEEYIDEISESCEEGSEEEEPGDETVETIDLFIKPSAIHSRREEATAAGSEGAIPLCNGLILYDRGKHSAPALAPPNKTNAKILNVNKEISANVKTKSEIVSKESATVDFNNSINRSLETSIINSTGKIGVLTKWRHSENRNTSTNGSSPPWTVVGGFEEVSRFKEKKEISLSSMDSEVGLHRYINEAKLSQLLAVTAIKLADVFKKETYSLEASQMYKYAYGIFKAYPLSGGQQEMSARLLVDIGSTCCSVGELESGSQLMKEAARLYENSGELQKEADVWYQLGNVYLSDSLRQESTLARVMQMIKEDVKKEKTEDPISDDSSECSSDEEDTYCTCIYDAVECYRRALGAMDKARETGQGQDPDLLANVLTNLADCRIMTGNLDQAEQCYEEALRLFSNTLGATLLQKNAHVLGMVGTLCFLARNCVRSATMYETSHILRQHLPETDEPTLEMAWNLTMLGLSYHFLGRYHQSITWCVRAFKLYTRFFRGRLLTVDALNRWFIVQTLYILGFAYITLRLDKKALHYLNFCKNMIVVDTEEDQDPDQSTRVFLTLGDAYMAVEDRTNAVKYYEEAQKRLETVEKGSIIAEILTEEIEDRLGGGEKSSKTQTTALDERIHQQAVFRQHDVECSIRRDMGSILLKLGFTTTSEKDIDWAISCYDECVQAYRDLKEPSEAARALSGVGTLCQVKGRLQDANSNKRQDFLEKAEKYFKEAFVLVDSASSVYVQYGNFLYCEGRYLEAIQILLPFVFCERSEDLELSYTGIEQMALPAHLHCSIDEEETLIVEARILAKFLALLCYRALKMAKDADETLGELYRSVTGTSKPLNYTLLGYAFLESRLFQEAAESFMWASTLQPESDLAFSVAWISLLLTAYTVLARGLDHFLRKVLESGKNDRNMWTFDEKKSYLRRQVSYRSRKIIRGNGVDQIQKPTQRIADNIALQGNAFVTSQANHSDASPSRLSPGVRRSFVIETRRWQPDELNGTANGTETPQTQSDEQSFSNQEDPTKGSKKKWRSRLYHNLPEPSDSERLMVDPRRANFDH